MISIYIIRGICYYRLFFFGAAWVANCFLNSRTGDNILIFGFLYLGDPAVAWRAAELMLQGVDCKAAKSALVMHILMVSQSLSNHHQTEYGATSFRRTRLTILGSNLDALNRSTDVDIHR